MNEPAAVNKRIFARLALAYLFASIDFHIGPVNILPEFVSWLLLLSVFRDMREAKPDIAQLNNFAYILLTVSILSPVLNLLTGGAIQNINWIPLSIISTMMSLYVWFITFTVFAQYCTDIGLDGKSVYRIRNCNIALNVAMFLLLQYLLQASVLLWILVLAQIILIIWFARVQMLLYDELTIEQKQENTLTETISEIKTEDKVML